MKMTKKFDDLNDCFNVEGEIVKQEPEIKGELKVSSSSEDVKKDYE